MKRTAAVMALLALAAGGGTLAYQAAARDRNYRLELEKGDDALADRKLFAAVEAYSGAIALRPDSMLAYLHRGEAYLQRGDLDLASRDLTTAADLDPAATRPLEDLGDVQYQRQRFSQAIQNYEGRLRLDDRSAEVTYKLALARYRGGDTAGALAAVGQTLKLNDQMADAYYLRGMCLRDQRQLVQALAAFERAIALAPASIAAREELSDLYAAQGRHAEQVEQLQVLAALDRDHVERQVALGLAQAHADHWDLAVLTLSAALDRSPNEPLLYCALGQVWLERPREKNDRVFLGKAREALERVASQPGATSAALLLYGRALLQQGDLEGAEQALHDATRRYPLAPAALTEYASLAERQSHLDPARTALVEYDALAGSDADASSRAAHIGALSLRLNDARGAIVWLKRATELAPGDARGFAALADAQLRAGDRAGADATTTRGLEKDPGNAALQALARRIHPA